MHQLAFVSDLAWFLGTGALLAALALRFRQPVLLGYLAAGLLLGSQGPFHRFLTHPESVEILGELGIVFLMFFLGTEFHLRKLKALGPAPLLAGILELSLTGLAGFELGKFLGLSTSACLFLGAILCMCSTTILVKSLSDLRLLKEEFASLTVGLTLVEDVAAILILIAASGWASGNAPSLMELLGAVGRVAAFSALVLAIGLGLAPLVFSRLEKLANAEVLAAAAIGSGVALSALAGSFGFSTALGAFLCGMVFSDSGFMPKIQEKLAGFRDLFAGLFFITVGFRADLATLEGRWHWVAAVVVVLIVSKVGSVFTSSLLIGVDSRTSLRAGLAMAHVGEFSFVVAGLGVTQGVLPPAFLGIVVAASTITTFTTPLFMRRGKKWGDQLEDRIPAGARTFHARYVSWLKALRVPLHRFTLPKNLYPLVLRAVVLTVLLIILGPSLPWVVSYLFPSETPAWIKPAMEVFFLTVFLALYLLFLNTLNRLFRHVLKSGGETMDKKGQTLLKLWMFVASAASAALFLAGAAPFISIWTILAAVAGMVAYLGGGLKRTLAPMDSRLDSFVDQVVKSASGEPADRATLKNLLQERYPLSAVVQDFMLPPEPTAANQTLAGLRLRKATGATVVSVYRGDLCLSNPGPEFRILPGDVLCLLGEKEHVQAAFGYLNDLCRRPPEEDAPETAPHLETVQVPENSPLIGRSLKDLSLRTRTGATVVGVERAGALNTSPSPSEPLNAGDVLLLLGGSDAVSRAHRMVASGDLGEAPTTEEELAQEAILRG